MEILGISFVLFFYMRHSPLGLVDRAMKIGNLGLLVGYSSCVATEVGGAFINGTAEEVYSKGSFGSEHGAEWSLSTTKMRRRQYVTVVDSLQESYGMKMGVLIYIPSFYGDICWTAALLTALGRA
ncbi:Uncharacterized protein FKW44_017511 [Caligus rogercresseyi]|uniref:Uncharacterized protein n=1 Tax=Caligus rogercresseyi TaxID=217165 RepID=A0A7T8GT21_CALRO|nr:Uncharacterized protein FKW44_017511 [Caligus rogercresseyi]